MPASIIQKKTIAKRPGFSANVLRVSSLNDDTPPPSTMDEIRNMYIYNRNEIKALFNKMEKASKFPAALRTMLLNEYTRSNLAIVKCSEMKGIARCAEQAYKESGSTADGYKSL